MTTETICDCEVPCSCYDWRRRITGQHMTTNEAGQAVCVVEYATGSDQWLRRWWMDLEPINSIGERLEFWRRNDPTVDQYFSSWRADLQNEVFEDREAMLELLVTQLANEKRSYLRGVIVAKKEAKR